MKLSFSESRSWATIDIVGAAWKHLGGSYVKGRGASGIGVRMFCQWILNKQDSK